MNNNCHQNAQNPAEFLFMSPYRSIRATGFIERIDMPVNPDGMGDQKFQHHVSEALHRASLGGISRPIIIGAIPFDLSRPTCLSIPQSYETFSRDTLVAAPAEGRLQTSVVLNSYSVPDEAKFKRSVQQAVANFRLSDIRKAVLSRILEVELAGNVDVGQIFSRLIAQNPTGYQFRLPLVDGVELIGASPELLVRKHADHIYSNPLAGSAKRQSNSDLDRQVAAALMRSDKDLYEHRFVTEEIQRVLAPLCQDLNVPQWPSLLSTAAMWHLSSSIEGRLADASMTALQVACKLHPTPALCGFPTGLARKLIDLVEPFERGMFAGMVGWCDADGNGEWAVTIRCGLIDKNKIRLFAGAGIVEDSCPESEWAETQAKLQTMLKAIGVELPSTEKNELPLQVAA